jgi:hypothetical protein
MSSKRRTQRVLAAAMWAITAFGASPVFATFILTAEANANVSAGRVSEQGTKLLTPGNGSLAVSIGAVASDSIPRDPNPGNHMYFGSLLGGGVARFGTLAGHARAEASSLPAGDADPYGAGGQVGLRLGFVDTVEVVSNTLAIDTPVRLSFAMMLDATAIHFPDGTISAGSIGASAVNEARIRDIEANTSTPPFSPRTFVNSAGGSQTLTTFQFDTAIGHHLELDVVLTVFAGTILDPNPRAGAAAQATAEVIANNTAHFFHLPTGDVRLMSESGHSYAIPEPSSGIAIVFLAVVLSQLVSRWYAGH